MVGLSTGALPSRVQTLVSHLFSSLELPNLFLYMSTDAKKNSFLEEGAHPALDDGMFTIAVSRGGSFAQRPNKM